jgi:ubiquinol-cytochrome c reductase cytochrome c1 subunit
MVRPIAFLVGLVFVAALLVALLMPRDAAEVTATQVFHKAPKAFSLASDGPLGRFDRQQLQRGFQVYKEVCSACHSLHLVAFRDLEEIGYNAAEVKAIANQWQIEVPSVNPDTGEATTRKAIPADHFPSPYANETAARSANNSALPPDLSLIVKAREGHAAYIHSLLTGYAEVPAELKRRFPESVPPATLHYNPYFANLAIAMPPPLAADGQVQYGDGTPSTIENYSADVSAFLTWAAEPKLEERHRTGLGVLIFLLIATTLGYFAYRNVWAGMKH